MALKVLLLRSKLDAKKAEMEALRAKDADFEQREQELEAAISEVTEDTPQEDREAVEAEVEKFEAEKAEHEEAKSALDEAIRGIEDEISEEVERNKEIAKPQAVPAEPEERKTEDKIKMRKEFFGMNMQERTAFIQDQSVKDFLAEVRSAMKEKRALTNIGETIPEVMLPLIREKAYGVSKLLPRVTHRRISGTGRQVIMGTIPEAFWELMTAALSELSLAFYTNEVDGFKVNGYFAVSNSYIEDSDLDLAAELISVIAQAIAKATDKAILYGKGATSKMPLGIVKSLLLTSAPDDYPATGRTWTDLHTSNIVTGTADLTGVQLFAEIVSTTGVADNEFETSEITWCMNKKTHTKLLAASMGTNASAAIVAGMNQMPVVGGEIIEFSYIPDDTIIFGYFKNYLVAERAGIHLAQSEHARFIQDQMVFRGTARYDGKPMIREAFGVYGIGGAPDTTIPPFAGE